MDSKSTSFVCARILVPGRCSTCMSLTVRFTTCLNLTFPFWPHSREQQRVNGGRKRQSCDRGAGGAPGLRSCHSYTPRTHPESESHPDSPSDTQHPVAGSSGSRSHEESQSQSLQRLLTHTEVRLSPHTQPLSHDQGREGSPGRCREAQQAHWTTLPQNSSAGKIFLSIAQLGCEWMMGWRGEEKMESVISLVAYLFGINQSHCFLVYRNSTDSRFNAWKLIVFIWLFSSLCWDELPHDCFLLSDASNVSGLWWWRLLLSHPQQETKQFMDRRKECVTHLFLTYLAFWEWLCAMCDWYLGASSW